MAVVSSACWTAFDVVRKRVGEDMSATGALIALMVFQLPFALPLLTIGALSDLGERDFVLWSLSFPPLIEPTPLYLGLFAGTLFFNVVANLLFLRAVQISPLSLTTPYLSFTPVFTALLSLVAYNEVPSMWGWVGITVVCLGAFFLNPGEGSSALAPIKALWTERGSLYMVLVALLWSFTPLIDKKASGLASPLWHVALIGAGTLLTFASYRIIKDGWSSMGEVVRRAKPLTWWLVAGGVTAVGALVVQLAAYEYTDIAYVETVKRAIGVTGAMLAGYVLFGERDIARRLVGAAVMLVGVA
ncbi:MAG: DMT family transporter, partial [Myxococcota bacterium]